MKNIDSNLLKILQKSFPVMNIIYDSDYKCNNPYIRCIDGKSVYYDIGISNIVVFKVEEVE